MKFLGLRVEDHDSNITYTDGKSVKYCATERLFGIKHHGFDNGWQWEDVLNDWGAQVADLDGVAVISDNNILEDGELYRQLDVDFPCPFFQIDHHYAHMLSLWPLTIPEVNYVLDGYGNNERSQSVFHGHKLVDTYTVKENGSIGIIMGKVGRTLDLKADDRGLDLAGKVMGLQAYGLLDESYYATLEQYSIEHIKDIWDYDNWPRNWDKKFDINWLRTVHEYTGDALAKLMEGPEIIGYSGGIAQNSVFNGKICKNQEVVIPPHVNDCGLSLGAVEFLRQKFDGEAFDTTGFPFWQDDEAPEEASDRCIDMVAEALAAGKIVGFYQGHGELGPRALGNRSILMNARDKTAKDTINSKVKKREHFRPFGAAVLKEDASKYFDCDIDVPFMNICCDVIDKELSSVTHIDGSSRIQTLGEDTPLRRVAESYKKLTGDSVLLNTSLNIGGKPIASKIWEAKEIFSKTEIDMMVVGDRVMAQ